MLDETKVFNQWWKEGDAAGGGDGGGGTVLGQGLYDLQGNFLGTLKMVPLGQLSGSKDWKDWIKPQLSVVGGPGGIVKFRAGSYLMDAGMGKMYHVTLNSSADIVKSATSTMSLGGGGGGGYATPQWRPGELELEQKALDQRLEEIQMGIDADIAAAEANHQKALEILAKELENATELEKMRIQADIGLENLRHENDLKELALRLDAERRNLIYSEIGATKRTLIQEKGATQREILGLGPDPLGQAAGLGGQATRGITPQQMAVGQAREFIDQPLPQASFDMPLPRLEAILAGVQGIQAPMAGGFGMAGTLGMAKGGTIEMKKGKDGKFSIKPNQKQAFLVGDGAGIIPGVTEVLTVGKNSVEVTPLVGGAQFGARIAGVGQPSSGKPSGKPKGPPGTWPPGTWPPGVPTRPDPRPRPGQPIIDGRPVRPQHDPDLIQSILQGLAPMYAGSIFDQVPQVAGPRFVEPGPNTPITFRPGFSPLAGLSALGIVPQLVRSSGPIGGTYFIQGGKRYFIPNGQDPAVLESFGLDPSQAVNISSQWLSQFPSGGVFTGKGTQAAGAVSGQTGYGALGMPLIEPVSGAILPSPHKIAGTWQGMSPIEQQVALSAYQHAGGPTGFGLGPQTVQDMIQTFTPAGRGYSRRIGGIGMQY